MKKFLYIHPHSYPLFSNVTSGGANRSQLFLRAITRVGHVDVISFVENEISNLPNCEVIYSGHPWYPRTKEYGRIGKLVRLLAPWNANNIFPLNNTIEKFLDGYISKKDYDYIVVRYIYMAAEFGLFKYADKLILDVDDNPQHTLLIRAKDADTLFRKMYYTMASLSAVFMSRIVLRRVCHVFYANIDERPSCNSVFLHNVSVMNNVLPAVSKHTPHRVVVVGVWSYFPNKEGLIHFLENIWPLVLSKLSSQVELRVIGRMKDDDLKEYCSRVKGVKVLGYVDNIIQEYTEARCVIIPIYNGTGTCIKTIEAMQVNRPFVSTPCGVRGLDKHLQSGRDYLLALDDNEFAEHLINLIEHPELGAVLAKNALECAQRNWSVDKFNEIISTSIK